MSATLLLAAALAGAPSPPTDHLTLSSSEPIALDIPPVVLVVAPPLSLPDPVRTMIEAAYKTGDDKTITAVVGLAKANFPNYLPDIEDVSAEQAKLLAAVRRETQEREQARIAAASFFDIWKGTLEAGGSRSTGTTEAVGIYASAKLTRDGLRWRQQIDARLDYQETNNVPSTERWLVAWQPNYKIDDQFYAYGLGQYEHDKFLGYNSRETLGVGLGYQAVSSPKLKITIEGGPAFRHTDYVAQPSRTTIAGRGSLSARWALSPTFSFLQDASVFYEANDATASSNTSLETKLIGSLRARFSYNVQFERESPISDRRLDTTTRATLVYGF
jgi:putative salt-induced outer membrane protein